MCFATYDLQDVFLRNLKRTENKQKPHQHQISAVAVKLHLI